jgi:hypothetical protein
MEIGRVEGLARGDVVDEGGFLWKVAKSDRSGVTLRRPNWIEAILIGYRQRKRKRK